MLRQSHEDLYSPKGHWIRETVWRLITLLLSIFNWFWNRFLPSEQLKFYRHVIGNTPIYKLGQTSTSIMKTNLNINREKKKRKNKEVDSMFLLYVLVCKCVRDTVIELLSDDVTTFMF
jgi:hypothetical protein